mgnify:CR=1 FL=1
MPGAEILRLGIADSNHSISIAFQFNTYMKIVISNQFKERAQVVLAQVLLCLLFSAGFVALLTCIAIIENIIDWAL